MYQLTLQLLDVVIPIYIYSWGGGKKWLQKPQIHLPLWVSLSLWDQYVYVYRCVCVCTQKSMWHWDSFSGPVVKTGLPMQGPKRDFWLWKFCTSRGMAKKKSLYDLVLCFPLIALPPSVCWPSLSLSPASLSCSPSSSHSPWVCCLSFRWHIDLKSTLYTGATTS